MANMKEELGLNFEVHAVSSLEYHEKFGLIEEQGDHSFLPLRGYGLVQDGIIVDASEDDYVGIKAPQIVDKLTD